MWLSLEHLRELFVTLAASSWLLALDVLGIFTYQQCRLVLCDSRIVCERPMDVRCIGLGGVPPKNRDGIVHGGFPLCHDSGPDGASNRSRRVTHGSHQSNVSKFCSNFAFAFACSSKTRLWQNHNVEKQRLRIFGLLRYLYHLVSIVNWNHSEIPVVLTCLHVLDLPTCVLPGMCLSPFCAPQLKKLYTF